MKQTLAILIVLGLLALGTAAFAQGEYGSEYAVKAFEGPRVQVGWVDPNDVDSTALYGASYIWQNALLSANYFSADLTNAAETAKVISLEASYLWRAMADPGLYYGGGYGLSRADIGGNTATHGLWNVLVGKEFNSTKEFGKPGMFLEGRWNFGSSIEGGNINGPRVVLGWKF